MGELIVSEFVTLDGVMEAPGGEPGHPHSGWVFPHVSEEWEADKHREVEEAGSLLLGRVTYDSHAGAWPQMAGPFADRMNTMRKRVVSRTLTEPEWANTEVIGMDAIDAVASFRREPDEPPMIVVGSHSLVQQLLAA
ncbi:MAG: dihydrofolate reductase family protein, partial [Miltoncostaeaceae bacterium]